MYNIYITYICAAGNKLGLRSSDGLGSSEPSDKEETTDITPILPNGIKVELLG